MKKLLALCVFAFSIHSLAEENPSEWVKKADSIRNPADSYEMKIKVETPENESVFQVFLQGQDKTLIVTKEPVRDKGRNMLMLDRDFNAYSYFYENVKGWFGANTGM